jgi:hypothetical protein
VFDLVLMLLAGWAAVLGLMARIGLAGAIIADRIDWSIALRDGVAPAASERAPRRPRSDGSWIRDGLSLIRREQRAPQKHSSPI